MSKILYSVLCFLLLSAAAAGRDTPLPLDFYGDTLHLPVAPTLQVPFERPMSAAKVSRFYDELSAGGLDAIAAELLAYRKRESLADWLYYQLIRTAAEALSPKSANYERYTLFKAYLLQASGYGTLLSVNADRILMYVQSDEEVFEIPCRMREGRQYVCLNWHDYPGLQLSAETFEEVATGSGRQSFSYRVTRLPDFRPEAYQVRELRFTGINGALSLPVLVNPQVRRLFNNYPVVDYEYYFTMPVSSITYSSLIPALRQQLAGLPQRKGVEYLMRLTRDAFPFQTDSRAYGGEKRLSPEQTLLYEFSDCEDRAAFFFYLVRELYDLPMIVLAYPDHVTVGVALDKPAGHTVRYNGRDYSICEATPQARDLPIGRAPEHLRRQAFEVVLHYK